MKTLEAPASPPPLHCADTGHAATRGKRQRRVRRAVAASASAATTLTLAALVIIAVYDYWPRVSQRVSTAAVPEPPPVTGGLARRRVSAAQEEAGRISLLVNALQETRADVSAPPPPPPPRPFFYLHRGTTPAPFRTLAAEAPRAWLDRYRSAQRLENLEHVVQYLQRNVRAQVADLLPASRNRIALTGVYVRPSPPPPPGEPTAFEASGGGADPLRGYRPHRPGDVNLLAEEPFRFSLQSTAAESARRFRRILFPPRRLCFGSMCTSCGSVGDSFGGLVSPRPSLIAFDIFPEAPSTLRSNRRRIANPATVPKPSFHPKGTSPTSALRDIYVVRPLHRPVHSMKASASKGNSLDFDFDTSKTKVGVLHSNIEMSTKIPYFHFGYVVGGGGGGGSGETVVRYETTTPSTAAPTTTTLLAVIPTVKPFLPYIHTYTSANSATTAPVDSVSMRNFNTLEILKFNAADARVPKIYGRDDFPSHEIVVRRDEVVESSTASARVEAEETGRKVIGMNLRKERVPPSSHTTAASAAFTINTGAAAPGTARAEPSNNGHYRSSHHISWPQPERSDTDSTAAATGAAPERHPAVSAAAPAPAGEGASRPEYIVIDRSARRIANTGPHTPVPHTVNREGNL